MGWRDYAYGSACRPKGLWRLIQSTSTGPNSGPALWTPIPHPAGGQNKDIGRGGVARRKDSHYANRERSPFSVSAS